MVKKVIPYETLYDLYVVQKLNLKQVAKQLQVHETTVAKRLKEYKIPTRGSSQQNRKYYCNEHYFDTIDTKSKAYLLGLICADGWVAGRPKNKRGNPCTLGLCLHNKDREVVEFLKSELQAQHPICKVKKHDAVSISINSVYLCSVLIGYGIVPNKSLTLNLEQVIEKANIDVALIPSFLLGYFDGDGGIRSCLGRNRKTVQWSCDFVGTFQTCQFLQRYFGEGKLWDEKSSGGNTYRFTLSGTNQVFRNLNKLYESHNGFCMERKHSKFLVLKGLLSQR